MTPSPHPSLRTGASNHALSVEDALATAVSALQKMMIVKARVRRGGQPAELAAEELVPGDVVQVEAGDLPGSLIRHG